MTIVKNQLVLGTILFAASFCGLDTRADAPLPEYKVKAAIVYKVAKFVNWPADSFESSDSPLSLCIAGTDPFGEFIDGIGGQMVQGRPIVVKRVADADLPDRDCHILFVASDSDSLRILSRIANRPMLTVGDSAGFAIEGGMLGLQIKDKRVRFEVNLRAARDSRLGISASLLQLARIVENPE